MPKKILIIICILGALALLAAVFFAGRGSAAAGFAANVKALKGSIDDGLTTTRQLIDDNKREIDYSKSLEEINGRIDKRLDGMDGKLTSGFNRMDAGITDGFNRIKSGLEEQRGYIEQLDKSDNDASDTIDQLGSNMESGIRLLDKAIEAVQAGHD